MRKHRPLNSLAAGDLEEARRPIASLISKSQKAQRKLAPGTWQHTMLRSNLAALRIALALIDREPSDARPPDRHDLQKAVAALTSMITRAKKAQTGLPPGTSQHTLQRNRLKAFRIAKALIVAAEKQMR